MAYREYIFIVRRRAKDKDGKARDEISRELSAMQAKLNSFRAQLQVEAPRVGNRYAELVTATRDVAGPLIKAPGTAAPSRTIPRYTPRRRLDRARRARCSVPGRRRRPPQPNLGADPLAALLPFALRRSSRQRPNGHSSAAYPTSDGSR